MYSKELVHAIMGAGKSKSAGWASRPESQAGADAAVQAPRLHARGRALGIPSADWVRRTHIMDGSLLYSKSINLSDHLI